MEGAHAEGPELGARAPVGGGDEFGKGRVGAAQAVMSRLTHIADRSVHQARTVAAMEPSAMSSPEPRHATTAAEAVGAGQAHRVLEAAERIFVSVTGHTGYNRDLSEEILTAVLRCVSAEEQAGYVRQLETFAEAKRGTPGAALREVRPGGPLGGQEPPLLDAPAGERRGLRASRHRPDVARRGVE